jgi:hypothetical protein
MHVWIVTVFNWHWSVEKTVAVCRDEATARKAVEEHGKAVEVYPDDWAVCHGAGGEVVQVSLESDECEVVATRWELR